MSQMEFTFLERQKLSRVQLFIIISAFASPKIHSTQRSYVSNIKNTYRFSKFEIAKPVLRLQKNKIIVDEFNFLNLESIQGKNFLFPSTDKYLDISFYNWNLLNHKGKETVVRFGLGKSIHFKYFAFSTLPYIGIQQAYHKNEAKIGSYQGFRLISQFIPKDEITIRLVITRYILSIQFQRYF